MNDIIQDIIVDPIQGLFSEGGSGGGTDPVGWQPTDLPNLIGWWDASDTSTITQGAIAGRVGQLDDKSGNANHLINTYVSGTIEQPERGVDTINGLDVLTVGDVSAGWLSPSGNLLDDTNLLDAQNCHVAIVFQNRGDTSATRQGALVQLKDTNGSDLINDRFASTNNPYFPENTGGAAWLIGSNNFALNTTHLLGFDADGSNMVAYANGVQIAETGAGATADHFNRFLVGYRASSSRAYDGLIAEMIVCQSLNTADRQDLEGYLANKWGIA